MRFYFDEAGDFAVPQDPNTHAVGIVVGVDIPELIEQQVFAAYQQFVSTLSTTEFKKGEPKGNLLSDTHLREFAEMMAVTKDLLITTTLIDLSTLAGGRSAESEKCVEAKFDKIASQCVYDSLRQEIELLKRQYVNLSRNQKLRLFGWSTCIFETLHQCVLWRADRRFDRCWQDIEYNIDPVQVKEGSREQQFFEMQVLAWVTGRTKSKPFLLIEEWHVSDHPFVGHYETDKGVDVGLLLRDKIRWPTSAASLGLQIADISASIVRKAVFGVANADSLNTYGLLMTRSKLGDRYAPGLCLIGDVDEAELGNRYYGLTGAIQRARKQRND